MPHAPSPPAQPGLKGHKLPAGGVSGAPPRARRPPQQAASGHSGGWHATSQGGERVGRHHTHLVTRVVQLA